MGRQVVDVGCWGAVEVYFDGPPALFWTYFIFVHLIIVA